MATPAILFSPAKQSTMTKTPASVSKTALDSIHSKLSAIDAGWLQSRDVNDTHPIHVYTNLLHQLNGGPKRRQSPLVNAGYAARMAVITHTMERWINGVVRITSQTDLDPNDGEGDNIQCINVVMVGCGMDALGIWSKHVLHRWLCKALGDNVNESNRYFGVNVYEFDAWDNCVLKTQAFLESGLISLDDGMNTSSSDTNEINDKHYHIHVQGRIRLETTESMSKDDDYTLISLDLREMQDDKSILSQATLHAGLDSSQPTIVVSELVLAYLGYKGADAVMHSISGIIHGCKLSMFACLEPMLPTDESFDGLISVKKAYAREYSRHFLGKLQTGSSERSSTPWLNPLGSDFYNLQSRLETCGLINSCCATLRECAVCVAHILRGSPSSSASGQDVQTIGSEFLCAKEPFDEYVALSLNLNCYCVVCSFHPSLANDETQSLIKSVCPWSTQTTNDDASISIKPISTSDEDVQVHELYGRLYQHMYNTFPPIRKMVKSALKGDLSIKPKPSSETIGNTSRSAIRDRFVHDGGDFWVATANCRRDNTTIVVGCIGVKRRSNRNTDCVSNSSTYSTKYEIYRFAVDDSYRGGGIGKRLLQVVETSSKSKGATEIYAVTPSCLLAANTLYESSGYAVDCSRCFVAGALRMNVYSKAMGCVQTDL